MFPRHLAYAAHDGLGEARPAVERPVLRAGVEHHRRVMADPSHVVAWADELSALATDVHTAFSEDEQVALVAEGQPPTWSERAEPRQNPR